MRYVEGRQLRATGINVWFDRDDIASSRNNVTARLALALECLHDQEVERDGAVADHLDRIAPGYDPTGPS